MGPPIISSLRAGRDRFVFGPLGGQQ